MSTPIFRLSNFWMSFEKNECTSSFERLARWKTDQYMNMSWHYFHLFDYNFVIFCNHSQYVFHFIGQFLVAKVWGRYLVTQIK